MRLKLLQSLFSISTLHSTNIICSSICAQSTNSKKEIWIKKDIFEARRWFDSCLLCSKLFLALSVLLLPYCKPPLFPFSSCCMKKTTSSIPLFQFFFIWHNKQIHNMHRIYPVLRLPDTRKTFCFCSQSFTPNLNVWKCYFSNSDYFDFNY